MNRATAVSFVAVLSTARVATAQTTETPEQPAATTSAPSAPAAQGARMRIVYANEGALDVSTRDGRMGPGLFIAGTVIGGVSYVTGVTLSFILAGGPGAVGLVPVIGPVISDGISAGRCSGCSAFFAVNTLPTLLLWSASIPMLIVGSRHFTQRPRDDLDRGQLVRRSQTPNAWALLPTTNGLLFSTRF